MPRNYCQQCQLPEKTCICSLITSTAPVQYPGEIHILQHPQEQRHSKNTGRLVKQLLAQVFIWSGETEADFSDIKQRALSAPENWSCIYPCSHSQTQTQTCPSLPATRLIFIDATWRKARKIWHLNPWLAQLPCYHLDNPPEGIYRIRKNHAAHQLSTLEAIAWSIHHVTDTQPLLSLFKQFQNQVESVAANANE